MKKQINIMLNVIGRVKTSLTSRNIGLRFLLLFLPIISFAHDGEDHGDAKKTAVTSVKYFSSEASSDKYELLIKYSPIIPGKETILQLFISEYNTNKPVDSASLQVSVPGKPNVKFSISRKDKGLYELKTTFPDKLAYNIIVNINSYAGVDLIQLNNIEAGKKLELLHSNEVVHTHWYTSNWFFGFAGLLVGVLLMFFINKRNRRIATTILILSCIFPASTYNKVSAHDGDDHGATTKGGGSSTEFLVEKQTQFLFNILTQKTGNGNFNESIVLLGTVTAAPQGKAVIQSPQVGKITSLRVSPGQRVSKGQVVATIEQQVDAGTQINILSQSNTVNSEYEAAKAQYERLKAIEDIAAKKDVTEAKARYEAARKNRALFNSNAGSNVGSTKQVTLTSPVSGVVSNFNYAIGAVVSAGQTLFEVTNLEKVFVEAQVFTADATKIKSATSFNTKSNTDSLSYALKQINTAQSVNEGNQSQVFLFEIVNPNGQFKIGENINVRVTGNSVSRQIVIPNEAITDINGKPAVFIKDRAEQYSISFVIAGQANDKFTVISKGVEDGERLVTTNAYQMKMIYLNQ